LGRHREGKINRARREGPPRAKASRLSPRTGGAGPKAPRGGFSMGAKKSFFRGCGGKQACAPKPVRHSRGRMGGGWGCPPRKGARAEIPFSPGGAEREKGRWASRGGGGARPAPPRTPFGPANGTAPERDVRRMEPVPFPGKKKMGSFLGGFFVGKKQTKDKLKKKKKPFHILRCWSSRWGGEKGRGPGPAPGVGTWEREGFAGGGFVLPKGCMVVRFFSGGGPKKGVEWRPGRPRGHGIRGFGNSGTGPGKRGGGRRTDHPNGGPVLPRKRSKRGRSPAWLGCPPSSDRSAQGGRGDF